MQKSKFFHQCNWLALILFFFTYAAAASEQSPIVLSNSSLQLEFNLSSGTVQHWLSPKFHTPNKLTHDMAAPEGKLFLLDGTLAGKSLWEWEQLAGGWKVLEQRADTLTLGLESSNLPFSIKKTWHLLDHDWRVDFALELYFKEQPVDPTDHLELKIGPGIGETPARGLGMGQSIYSFTELVYQNSNGVEALRLNNEALSKGYSSHDAKQWNWVGLQSRYLALIMSPANDLARNTVWQANTPQEPPEEKASAPFNTSLSFTLPIADNDRTGLQVYQWNVFGGGKSYQALTAQTPNLGELLFSGLWNWLRELTLAIMHVLYFIQQLVGSWGVSIILLAMLVRLALHPIAKNSILAQKKFESIQAKIQPELLEIRKNYKGGEQSERILQLYESHKVSPLAGLKPLLIVLIQVPVFVSLFHLLGQTFELRDASFLWIKTLAEPDQLFELGVDLPLFGAYFNLLPVLMSLTTLLSTRLNPISLPDGKSSLRHRLTTVVMGLSFFLLFYSFPSGMVLYWTVANVLQVLHQKLSKAG